MQILDGLFLTRMVIAKGYLLDERAAHHYDNHWITEFTHIGAHTISGNHVVATCSEKLSSVNNGLDGLVDCPSADGSQCQLSGLVYSGGD